MLAAMKTRFTKYQESEGWGFQFLFEGKQSYAPRKKGDYHHAIIISNFLTSRIRK